MEDVLVVDFISEREVMEEFGNEIMIFNCCLFFNFWIG